MHLHFFIILFLNYVCGWVCACEWQDLPHPSFAAGSCKQPAWVLGSELWSSCWAGSTANLSHLSPLPDNPFLTTLPDNPFLTTPSLQPFWLLRMVTQDGLKAKHIHWITLWRKASWTCFIWVWYSSVGTVKFVILPTIHTKFTTWYYSLIMLQMSILKFYSSFWLAHKTF